MRARDPRTSIGSRTLLSSDSRPDVEPRPTFRSLGFFIPRSRRLYWTSVHDLGRMEWPEAADAWARSEGSAAFHRIGRVHPRRRSHSRRTTATCELDWQPYRAGSTVAPSFPASVGFERRSSWIDARCPSPESRAPCSRRIPAPWESIPRLTAGPPLAIPGVRRPGVQGVSLPARPAARWGPPYLRGPGGPVPSGGRSSGASATARGPIAATARRKVPFVVAAVCAPGRRGGWSPPMPVRRPPSRGGRGRAILGAHLSHRLALNGGRTWPGRGPRCGDDPS